MGRWGLYVSASLTVLFYGVFGFVALTVFGPCYEAFRLVVFVAFMGHWGGPPPLPFGIYSANSVYGALGLDFCGFYGVCVVYGVF